MPFDAFLSYRSTNLELASALKRAVERRRLAGTAERPQLWFDQARSSEDEQRRGIAPGDPILIRILEGLRSSRALLLLLSDDYMASEACCRELEFAYIGARGQLDPPRIIVVCAEDGIDKIPFKGLRAVRASVLPILSGSERGQGEAALSCIETAADEVCRYLARLRASGVQTLQVPDAAGAVFGAEAPRPNPHFVGRIRPCWEIENALQDATDIGAPRAAPRTALIEGLPGTGKASLVRHFCDRWALQYPGGAYWVRLPPIEDLGENRALMPALLAQALIAQLRPIAFGLSESGYREPSTATVIDEVNCLRAFIGGCLQRQGKPFVWIVEGVPRGLGRRELESWLAPMTAFTHQILILRDGTDAEIRRHATSAPIIVADLGEEESVRALDARLERNPFESPAQRQAVLRQIVATVGGYPLALEAAALSLQSAGLSEGGYASLLERIDPGPDLQSAARRGYGLISTFDRLTHRLEPLDRRALALLAAADGLPVPRLLLAAALFGEMQGSHGESALDPETLQTHARAVDASVTRLDALGLLVAPADSASAVQATRSAVTIARQVLRLRDGMGPAATALTAALRAACAGQAPLAVADIDQLRALAYRLIGAMADVGLADALAAFEYRAGQYRSARELYESVLSVRQNVLGSEDPVTLTAMNDLAVTLGALGELRTAEQSHRRVIELRRRVLGSEHPDTLTSMSNLAVTLKGRGDLPAARQLQEQVLEIRRRVLGAKHLDTLRSVHNLAGTLFDQRELAEARELQEQVLEDFRYVLGPEHPDTLTSMNSLAGTLHFLRELSAARRLLEDLLPIQHRVLGAEHPDTLTSMNAIAVVLMSQGELPNARHRLEEVLEHRRRKLGAEHPDTLRSSHNLAMTLKAQGDLPAARQRLEDLLPIMRRVLGDEHPDTLNSTYGLAEVLLAEGELPAARTLVEQVVTIRCRARGVDDPDVVASLVSEIISASLSAGNEPTAAPAVLGQNLDAAPPQSPADFRCGGRVEVKVVHPLRDDEAR